jgi:AAA+ superfamily predicted ATPase
MSAPQQRACTVSYGSGDFEEATDRIGEALRSGAGMIFLFIGASQEQKQEALTKLSAPDRLNLHQYGVPNLIGERLVETQGHLREAFDTSDEDAAVIFFDEADVLLDSSHADAADADDAALSDYFFDRVESYPGVAVVCFSAPEYVGRLEGHGADVVVTF